VGSAGGLAQPKLKGCVQEARLIMLSRNGPPQCSHSIGAAVGFSGTTTPLPSQYVQPIVSHASQRTFSTSNRLLELIQP